LSRSSYYFIFSLLWNLSSFIFVFNFIFASISFFLLLSTYSNRLFFHQAQRFGHFQLRLFFHQAQGFGANIFNSAYFFIKRKGLAQTFSTPPMFSSSAKVWRKYFSSPPIFLQMQGFGANNYKRRLGFRFPTKSFSKPAKTFLQFVSHSKVRYARSQMQCSHEKKGVKQRSQSKAKQKVKCVPLKRSENSFCKKNVKS
jgi:hypothetical protein